MKVYRTRRIILSCILGLVVAVGLARFSYPVLLPFMKVSLGLSNLEAGFLNSVNFAGWLAGVAGVALWGRNWSSRNAVVITLLLLSLLLLATSLPRNFSELLLIRALTGIASAVIYVYLIAITNSVLSKEARGKVMGLVIGTPGLGVALAALLVGWLRTEFGADFAWRTAWAIFAALAILTLGPARWWLPPKHEYAARSREPRVPLRRAGKRLLFLCITYFSFGVAYTAYTTFFVEFMTQDLRWPAHAAGTIWATASIIGSTSGVLWGAISDRFGRARALSVVLALQSACYGALIWEPAQVAFASALVYGLTAMAVPTVIASLAGELFPGKEFTRVFGVLTTVFAQGQFLGPIVGGLLRDITSNTAGIFTLSFGGSLVAFLSATALGYIGRNPRLMSGTHLPGE